MNVRQLAERSRAFQRQAAQVLARVDSSHARIITVEEGYRQLGKLSLTQHDLFVEAFRCAEHGLFRAAHVMAWAAFMDFVHEKLFEDGFAALRQARPKWKPLANKEDLREYRDSQVVETLKLVRLCGKGVCRSLDGDLSRRNECGHPTGYSPGLNETLGYISGLLQRISALQPKKPRIP